MSSCVQKKNEFASLPRFWVPGDMMANIPSQVSIPRWEEFSPNGTSTQPAVRPPTPGPRNTARVTPPPCIDLAVLLSVRKLLADRQMGHAKKSVRHFATSR
jgi:hypothetical protein